MKNGYVTAAHVQQLMRTFDNNPTETGHTLKFLGTASGLGVGMAYRIINDIAPEAFVNPTVGRFQLSGIIPEGIHPDLHRPPLNLPTPRPKNWEWNADALAYLDGLMGTPTFRDFILSLTKKDLRELSIIGKTMAHAADEMSRKGESSVPTKPQG